MDTGVSPTTSVQPKTSSRMFVKIVIGVGILMAIFLVIAIFLSSKDYSSDVANLSARETEIARIAEFATDHDNATQSVKIFAASVRSIALSSVNILSSIDGGSLIDPSVLASAVDSSVDTALNTAAASNVFEDKFFDIMQTKLADIANRSSILINQVDAQEKQILQTMTANFQELLSEISTSD